VQNLPRSPIGVSTCWKRIPPGASAGKAQVAGPFRLDW
jgi:hypothetical protein